ncbi:hypothetical protein KPH14_000709, partial [Odynerus spinipes]
FAERLIAVITVGRRGRRGTADGAVAEDAAFGAAVAVDEVAGGAAAEDAAEE